MNRPSAAEKIQLEKVWLNAKMANNAAWNQCRALTTEYVYHNESFVVFDLIDGQPRIFDVVRVRGLSISWGHGLTVTLASSRGLPSIYVTSQPRNTIPGVFLWLPAHTEVRHAPAHPEEPLSTRHAQVTMCIKTRTLTVEEGARYMLTLTDFQGLWPELLKGL